jgi:hypothetical protein
MFDFSIHLVIYCCGIFSSYWSETFFSCRNEDGDDKLTLNSLTVRSDECDVDGRIVVIDGISGTDRFAILDNDRCWLYDSVECITFSSVLIFTPYVRLLLKSGCWFVGEIDGFIIRELGNEAFVKSIGIFIGRCS